VTVASFVEQDGQLAVGGTPAGTEAPSAAPLALTVIANVASCEDAGPGCAVQVSTADTFIDAWIIIFLTGAGFTLRESTEPGSARELCRVVQAATTNSSHQSAPARTFHKVLRGT
jgi:hypothetical protein